MDGNSVRRKDLLGVCFLTKRTSLLSKKVPYFISYSLFPRFLSFIVLLSRSASLLENKSFLGNSLSNQNKTLEQLGAVREASRERVMLWFRESETKDWNGDASATEPKNLFCHQNKKGSIPRAYYHQVTGHPLCIN